MAISQNHIINIQPGVSAPLVIHCSQGDTGTQINLTVVNGDEEFDCSSYACSVHGTRSDRANWGPVTCDVSGSTVSFSLTSEMTAVAGSCLAEVSIGSVGTANFAMLMENAIFENGVTYSNDVSVYQNILNAVQAGLSLAEAAVNAEATARQIADNTLQGNINSEAATRASADSNLQSQINQIVAPSGEAPSAAEVQNARIGADGVTYDTLGTAIRTQVSNLNDKIKLVEPINIFDTNKVVKGYFTHGEKGSEIEVRPNSSFNYAIIPIEPNVTYTISGSSFYIYILDKDRKVIDLKGRPSDSVSNFTFSTGYSNAKFVVINYRPETFPTNSYMMVKGTKLPDTYTSYFDKYYKFNEAQYYATLKDLHDMGGTTYHVGNGREYESFIKCIKDLSDNTSKKTIYVDGGEYNIFEEIGGKAFCDTIANGETDWGKYSVIIPPNTTIIGLGNVVFNFTPTIEEIGNGLKLLSPINIQGTCHLENITINASNCRYCIHDETSGDTKFTGAKKTYKNVHCIKGGAGYAQAYASGFDDLMEFNFENCTFESTLSVFSLHNRDTASSNLSSRININNCLFISSKSTTTESSVRFGNINWHKEQIKVFISNSYMSHKVLINNETNYGTQNYDVTMIGCNRDNIDIVLNEGDTNRFVPTIYKW